MAKQPLYPHVPKGKTEPPSSLETAIKHDIDIEGDAKNLAERLHGLLGGEGFRKEMAEIIYSSTIWKKIGYYPFFKRYYPTKEAQRVLIIQVLTRALDRL